MPKLNLKQMELFILFDYTFFVGMYEDTQRKLVKFPFIAETVANELVPLNGAFLENIVY